MFLHSLPWSLPATCIIMLMDSLEPVLLLLTLYEPTVQISLSRKVASSTMLFSILQLVWQVYFYLLFVFHIGGLIPVS